MKKKKINNHRASKKKTMQRYRHPNLQKTTKKSMMMMMMNKLVLPPFVPPRPLPLPSFLLSPAVARSRMRLFGGKYEISIDLGKKLGHKRKELK